MFFSGNEANPLHFAAANGPGAGGLGRWRADGMIAAIEVGGFLVDLRVISEITEIMKSSKASRHDLRAPARMAGVMAGFIVMVTGGMFLVDPPVAGWAAMVVVSAALFVALKAVTLSGCADGIDGGRLAIYLLAWPGLNARAFLRSAPTERAAVRAGELAAALGKTVLGLTLFLWAVLHVRTAPVMIVGWMGMLGIIFTLHFGMMHVVSCVLRRMGFEAPPIMNAPMRAVSLTEFWSARWNRAFADVARRFVFRPLVRRCGAVGAGGVVFLVSGLVHEAAISLPARGGWGGPTLYFVLSALGIAIERSRVGVVLGLGRGVRGWLWVFGFTVLPLPLLFHTPFVERVIVPMLKDFNLLIP